MKWTGEDILAQLDEGWEIDEIAAATGMGIAEVKRLIREQRYKNTTQAKVETMTMTKQEETTQAEHPEWEWSSIRALSMLPGAPPYGTLQYRFRSGTAQWAHYETAKPEDLEGVEADSRARSLGRLAPGTTWEPLEPDQDEQPTDPDKAPKRETAKENAQIAAVETALIAAREEAAKHKATIAQLAKERDALEKIGEVLARHTAFGGDELSVSEMCELIEAAFEDAARLPGARNELERVSNNLLALHRECERRGYGADDKRPAVEKVHDIIDYAEECEQLAARQGQRIKELETCRVLAADTRETWKERAEAAEAIQSEVSKLLGEHFDLNDWLEAEQITRMLRQLIAVSEDHEAIEELLRDDGSTTVGSNLAPSIKKLLEETDTPKRLDLGLTEKEAGGTIAQWLDRLADLENEIATAYALRSTEDFADPDDRCWDLEHATKHVRRWQEVVEEQDREAGR